MGRGVAALHVIQRLFLVQIDEHGSIDRVPDPGALDLARLKHDISVRQHHRTAEALEMRDRGEGFRKEQPGKGKLQKVIRNLEKMRIVIESRAKRLQGAQVIRKSETRARFLEDI